MHSHRCLITRHVAVLSPAAAMTILPVFRCVGADAQSKGSLPPLPDPLFFLVPDAWPCVPPEVTSADSHCSCRTENSYMSCNKAPM